MIKDPLTTTQDATNAGTDVSIGPGEIMPEQKGKRRPGAFSSDSGDTEASRKNSDSNSTKPRGGPVAPASSPGRARSVGKAHRPARSRDEKTRRADRTRDADGERSSDANEVTDKRT